MKRIILYIFCLALVLQSADATASQSNDFDKPIPAAARQSFNRANKLADQEKFTEALAEYKKGIAAAPQFLQAHIKYINTKGYLMERLDEVKAEYESLAAKNPADPVYPAALAIGMFTEPQTTKNKWLETVARIAPEFAFKDFDGKEHRLSDFRGRVLLLDFWGLWCSPCVAEAPNLAAAYKKLKEKGFEIISLDKGDTTENLRKFIALKQMNWTHVQADLPLLQMYRIDRYPTYYLLDKEGKVISDTMRAGDEMYKKVEEMLGK